MHTPDARTGAPDAGRAGATSEARTMARGLARAALLAAGACAALAACGTARRVAEPDLRDPVLMAGYVSFMRNCHQCHPRGEAGLGPALNNKPLPAFLIRTQTRAGLGSMPAYPPEVLPDAELDAIAAYLVHLRGLDAPAGAE